MSRSQKDFFAFLQTPGYSIEQVRALIPRSGSGTVCLIDPAVSNEELGEYITVDASEYSFEIFLRVVVSLVNQRVYRYIVRGDSRNVKMGYGFFTHPELYDAIYLHTHPKGKRIIPNSIGDYMHAKSFKGVHTLLVGDGINIEFETVASHSTAADSIDLLIVDGTELSLRRPSSGAVRSKIQMKRRILDAEGSAFRLDRVFREKVEDGHESIIVKSADGMLATYNRNRTLPIYLDEVYESAQLPLPTGDIDMRWKAIGRAEIPSKTRSIDAEERPRAAVEEPS